MLIAKAKLRLGGAEMEQVGWRWGGFHVVPSEEEQFTLTCWALK